MKQLIVTVLLIMLTACTDPFISIPGGKLSGASAAAPQTWSALPDVVQLEVRPDNPYSLNIWAVEAAGAIYVATREARWLTFIEQNNQVRLKAGDTVYDLQANRVSDDNELARVSDAYMKKYETDAGGDTTITVLRLDPRS